MRGSENVKSLLNFAQGLLLSPLSYRQYFIRTRTGQRQCKTCREIRKWPVQPPALEGTLRVSYSSVQSSDLIYHEVQGQRQFSAQSFIKAALIYSVFLDLL